MTESNPKNRLQEFCQKNRLELPKYELIATNSEGDFMVECSIRRDGARMEATGEGLRVKEAGKMAAQNLLYKLQIQEERKVNYIRYNGERKVKRRMVIYLDMENINVKQLQELFKYNQYEPEYFVFVGFLSTGHHYAQTDFDFGGVTFEKILVPSTRSDAADIGIVMYVMENHFEPDTEYTGCTSDIMIVSRDRFSCVFVELASKGFCFNSEMTKVHHASNLEEMRDMISALNVVI